MSDPSDLKKDLEEIRRRADQGFQMTPSERTLLQALDVREKEIERLCIMVGVNGAECAVEAYVEACREMVRVLGKSSFPEPSGTDYRVIYLWLEWAVSCIRGEPWEMPPITLRPYKPDED